MRRRSLYLIAAHRFIPRSAVAYGSAAWVRAMVLLIFAYGGFEAAVVSAGEAKDPQRDMPFGLFAALITCAAIYTLIQWVVVGVLPDPAHSEPPPGRCGSNRSWTERGRLDRNRRVALRFTAT